VYCGWNTIWYFIVSIETCYKCICFTKENGFSVALSSRNLQLGKHLVNSVHHASKNNKKMQLSVITGSPFCLQVNPDCKSYTKHKLFICLNTFLAFRKPIKFGKQRVGKHRIANVIARLSIRQNKYRLSH